MVRSRLLLAFCAGILQHVCATTRSSDDANGSQYIAFNGSVSAKVTWPAEFSSEPGCGPVSTGSFPLAYLYVGLNPPWDPNPFFFELYHLSSDPDAGLFSFTTDDVYNLDFRSSNYACWEGTAPCRVLTFSYHYEPEILLNLTQATVKKIKIGNEDGYEVDGDETSFIKNTTERASLNAVDVYSWCYAMGLDFTDGLVWNDTIKWTYKISFSNSTGSATISSEIRGAKMEIDFSGKRITNGEEVTNSSWPHVELVTDNETKPQFRFSNDSQIYFKNSSDTWIAGPTPFPSETPTPTYSTSFGRSTSSLATALRPSNTGAADTLKVQRVAIPLLALGCLLAF